MPSSIENIRIKVPAKAQAHLSNDHVMKTLLSQILPSFPPSKGNVYQDLIEAIVYQQISIKAAKSIYARIANHFGGAVPPPDQMSLVEHDELRGLGLSNQKARYMHNIATFFDQRQLSHSQFVEMTDMEVIGLLTEIKGVGNWTAQMILIFSLWRPDVFPVADYGIETAMVSLYHFKTDGKKELIENMIEVSEKWMPYRTYGTLLLWGWKRAQMNL
ncbi:MAG: DNA-3-methyladenine glycosylase 2 family protein [Bacteroidetes bacterium]|nr:MAG: DNA-3-methyladenine glycosylase 2 family protein [Bacteroidota bacterium]